MDHELLMNPQGYHLRYLESMAVLRGCGCDNNSNSIGHVNIAQEFHATSTRIESRSQSYSRGPSKLWS